MPDSEEQLFDWCAGDPRFFLELCTMIRNDVGIYTHWLYNPIQVRQHDFIYEYISPHQAIVKNSYTLTVKSRQYGESTRELGDAYHQYCYRPSVTKVITYRDETSKKLKFMVDTFDETAHEFFASLSLDPDDYLPLANVNTGHELICESTGSRIEFTSENARGAGRSATVNRIYGTEYSEWLDPEETMSGYGGSLAKSGTRVHLDFTGKGIGNEAYREYQAAKRDDSAYSPRFYGRNDFVYDPVTDQGYTPEFLDQQRKLLRDKFPQEYPATDEEAFMVAADTRFKATDIFACGEYDTETGIFGAKYLCDVEPFKSNPELLLDEIFSHGCDPAEGIPTGSKTAISTRHPRTGMLACEPLNDTLSPRDCAFELRRRVEKYPGLVIVERNNHGHAVLGKCQDLSLRSGPFKGKMLDKFLYRHPEAGKTWSEWKVGWPETRDNKSLMESEYEERLAERKINMPCEALRTQAREYCLRDNGTTGRPLKGEKHGGKRTSYDDLAIADMIAIQGFEQALRITAKRRTGAVALRS